MSEVHILLAIWIICVGVWAFETLTNLTGCSDVTAGKVCHTCQNRMMCAVVFAHGLGP